MKRKKAIIIGIDGCRTDSLKVANTPFIDSLINEGAHSFNSWTGKISDSGTGWSSLLTGVWFEKHGVRTNSFKFKRIDKYPHLYHYLKKHNPNLVTANMLNWEPINRLLHEGDADIIESYNTDQEVADGVSCLLETKDPDLIFIQLDDVDSAGHGDGFTPKSKRYINAIENKDKNVKQIVESIRNRKSFDKEDWLIIVTTDHGGSPSGSHGANSAEDRNIFIILHGDQVEKGEVKLPTFIIDVCATVMRFFDYSTDKIDGFPFGLKTDIRKEWTIILKNKRNTVANIYLENDDAIEYKGIMSFTYNNHNYGDENTFELKANQTINIKTDVFVNGIDKYGAGRIIVKLIEENKKPEDLQGFDFWSDEKANFDISTLEYFHPESKIKLEKIDSEERNIYICLQD